MQPCRKRSKNLEAAKDAASPEKIARFNDDIARFQELRDKMAAQAAEERELLPTMQADVDAAQAKYDGAINRVSELQAELDKALEALGDEEPSITIKEHIKQLRSEIVTAKAQEDSCKTELRERCDGLKRQERRVNDCERAAEKYKAHTDQFIAWRDALLDNLKKAQTAYDDACKAYEEAKAAQRNPPRRHRPLPHLQPAKTPYQAPPSRRTRAAASKQIRPPASSRTRATQRRAQSHSQESPPQASE